MSTTPELAATHTGQLPCFRWLRVTEGAADPDLWIGADLLPPARAAGQLVDAAAATLEAPASESTLRSG